MDKNVWGPLKTPALNRVNNIVTRTWQLHATIKCKLHKSMPAHNITLNLTIDPNSCDAAFC